MQGAITQAFGKHVKTIGSLQHIRSGGHFQNTIWFFCGELIKEVGVEVERVAGRRNGERLFLGSANKLNCQWIDVESEWERKVMDDSQYFDFGRIDIYWHEKAGKEISFERKLLNLGNDKWKCLWDFK